MDAISRGKELILNRSNAFNNRYFCAYGHIALQVDDFYYLMTKENLPLSDIREEDINVYELGNDDISRIFLTRSDINAIVFACTPASAKFSLKADVMKPALDDLAQIVGEDVKVAKDVAPRTLLKALKGRNGCFIRGAGICAVGSTIEEAIAATRILEKSAEAEMFADQLLGLQYLPAEEAKKLREFYDKSYSKVNKEGHVEFVGIDPEEFHMRNKIIDCGKELCRHDLVQGTWGNISTRLNDREMLITPSGMDYFNVMSEDIVKVDINTLDYGMQRKPSSECRLHAALYRKYPDCNAVIHTHSNGCCVFAAANAGFRIENEDIRNVIGDLHVSEYREPGTEEMSEAVMEALEGSKACIVANHGAVFYGDDLDTVFEIADAVETKACNLLGFDSLLEDVLLEEGF